MNTPPPATHELRYVSLFNPGRGLSFPCDGNGCVDLDALSDRARENYLYARAVVGVEYAMPTVGLRSATRQPTGSVRHMLGAPPRFLPTVAG